MGHTWVTIQWSVFLQLFSSKFSNFFSKSHLEVTDCTERLFWKSSSNSLEMYVAESLCFLQWILSTIIFHAILRKFSEKSLSKPFTKDILSLSIYFYWKMMILADISLLKVNNRNTKTRCEICSKLTIKNTRMTSIASFCCFYC